MLEHNRVAERLIAQHFGRTQAVKRRAAATSRWQRRPNGFASHNVAVDVARTQSAPFANERVCAHAARSPPMIDATTTTTSVGVARAEERAASSTAPVHDAGALRATDSIAAHGEREPEVEESRRQQVVRRQQSTSKPTRSFAHDYCVYLLQSTVQANRTYCGVTNRRHRRIRQHNGEILGGAVYTRVGRPYRMYGVVEGFADKRDALRFEWSCHHPRVRRLSLPHKGRDGRLHCVRQLLAREPWLSQPLRVYVSDGGCLGGVAVLTDDYLLFANNLCVLVHDAHREPAAAKTVGFVDLTVSDTDDDGDDNGDDNGDDDGDDDNDDDDNAVGV